MPCPWIRRGSSRRLTRSPTSFGRTGDANALLCPGIVAGRGCGGVSGTVSRRTRRRVLHRVDDVLIAGAAAEVAVQPVANLLLARLWIVGQQVDRRQDHAGRAVAALQSMFLPEPFLQRMELPGLREPLDRRYVRAIRLDRKEGARLRAPSIHEHRTGPALTGVAPDVHAGQIELLPQKMHQQQPRLHLCRPPLPVHRDRYARHGATILPRRPCASSRSETDADAERGNEGETGGRVLQDTRRQAVGVVFEEGLEFDRVIAVEQIDHLDVPRPPTGRCAAQAGDPKVDARVGGQAATLQVVEASEVGRVDQRPDRVARRDEPPVLVLVGGDSHADRWRVGKAGRHLRRRGDAPPGGQPELADGIECVPPVVLEWIAQPVRLPIRTSPGVRQPAGQPGCRVVAHDVRIETVRRATAAVDRDARDLRRGRHTCRELGGKVVPTHTGAARRLGLEPSDDEPVERLVVALDAYQHVGTEILLEARHQMRRAFVSQRHDPIGRQVEEVVGLNELLVARALCVESARHAQPALPAERDGCGKAGRDDGVAVDGAPVEPQARLERETRCDDPSVGDPGAAPRAVKRRVERLRQAHPASHARRVRDGLVAIAGDGQVDTGGEAVQLDAGIERVRRRHLKAELLADRQITHRECPVEHEARHTDRDAVVRVVRAPRIRFEARVDTQQFRVSVPRDDGARRRRRPEQRLEPKRGEVVPRLREETAHLARRGVLLVVVQPEVRVLAARQTQDRQAVSWPERPVGLKLHVGERRQVLVGDKACDQVVVGPPAGHQPRSTTRRASLEHHVGVGHAGRRRSADVALAHSVVDNEQRRQPVAVRSAEAARAQLEPLDRLRIERADQAEQSEGVVDLDAVHHRQILIRRPASNREPGAEVAGQRHARQRVKRAEDVIDGARNRKDILGGDGRGGRPRRRRPRRDHLHRLGEGVREQQDLQFGARLGQGWLQRDGGLQITVRRDPEGCVPRRQGDREPAAGVRRGSLGAAVDRCPRQWLGCDSVDDDTRHDGRWLRRRRHRQQQWKDQQGEERQHATVRHRNTDRPDQDATAAMVPASAHAQRLVRSSSI